METNVIYCGDCLEILKGFSDESIDLIYLDPPFFSKKEYENFWIKDKASKLKFSDSKKHWERIKRTINPNVLKEYEEIEKRWGGRGHSQGVYVYIAYMRERLEQCWRVLKPTGTIYVHCDWHAGHYLKMVMDTIFGYENFRNEIVWCYAGGGIPKKDFPRKHDTIFRYSKTDDYVFNVEYRPYSEGTLKVGGGRHSLSAGGGKVDIERGTPINDWWEDLPKLTSYQKQWLGYPTQKPENLIERIIKVSSNEGDVVLDPFCGCGTTLAVADRLNRKWIGIDISRTACDVMRKRLGKKIRVIGGETEKELSKMEPHEFARIVIVEKMGGTINPKKSGDMGIDGWVDFMAIPVQVKRWENKVGRQEVDKFLTAIRRDEKKKGMIVAFDFSGDAKNEVERIKITDKIDIQLKTVSEIFGLDYYGK